MVVYLVVGCEQIGTTQESEIIDIRPYSQDLLVDGNANVVTADQAVNVALMFNASQPWTKSSEQLIVENVLTI